MSDKVLFVDDEPAFLTAYKLTLPEAFAIETAVGGEEALTASESAAPTRS